MTTKWTGNHSETGILRKSEYKEKKEELFVFGYSCKLFRNDDRALHIDQGKHLIPWMGDETLKIDSTGGGPAKDAGDARGVAISYGDTQRWYDARGALHDLTRYEAPPGGFDWRVELTKSEHDVEQMCDEERYRALHTDEDEELMYKEEELKRLHAAGYGQVGFNYDAPAEPSPSTQPVEVDEPFIPAPAFKALFQHDIVFPETQKQNAIIEKTSKFIATQGTQMEILIKAKQGDNPQFRFLNKDDVLHPYYMALTGLVKSGKWPEKAPEVVEEKPPEHDEYLHPSLASTIIESAPSIPSIQYKPSADCDYTMLVSKMRDEGAGDAAAPGELPPPGTEPPAQYHHEPVMYNTQVLPPIPAVQPQLLYHQQQQQQQQYLSYYQQYVPRPPPPPVIPVMEPLKHGNSTGLSLMKSYGSGSDTEQSDSEESTSNDNKPSLATPPDDVRLVIEKMSTYVARNGDEFADIVRAKNDPRFTFLDPNDVYHPYYNKLMREKRDDLNGVNEKKPKPPVSFSIKKMKEPDPILPKPALPYESSSDEDPDKQTDTQPERPEEPKSLQQLFPQNFSVNNVPTAVIYKMEGQLTQNLPTVKTIESFIPKPTTVPEIKELPKPVKVTVEYVEVKKNTEELPAKERTFIKEPSPIINIQVADEEKEKYEKSVEVEVRQSEIARVCSPDYKREKTYKDRHDYRPKSRSREKRSKSIDRERKKEKEKEKERDAKRNKTEKDDLESEIISLEDNSDDLIDLTGDQSDSKVDCETEAEKAKQIERRRRAAEFLKKVGVDPGAAALPTNSLASAMVDTLESIRKKKAAEEEKRRRKEKRRRREKRDYEDSERSHRKSKRRKYKSSDENDDSEYESSKRKKRKKDKKISKKKKRRGDIGEDVTEEDQPLPANIDLSSTLKELRTNSPTKNLLLPDIEENVADESSSEEDREEERHANKKKRDREYSEGEWSSDSEMDSAASAEERLRREKNFLEEGNEMEE